MSKKLIAENNQQGIPTSTTIPKCHILVNGINDTPVEEKKNASQFTDGYTAAAVWWNEFLERKEAAEGYFFYSNLRESIPPLRYEAQCQFLDAIGELMVSWMVSGEPSSIRSFGPACVEFTKLSPEGQDAQVDDNGSPLTNLALAMERENTAAIYSLNLKTNDRLAIVSVEDAAFEVYRPSEFDRIEQLGLPGYAERALLKNNVETVTQLTAMTVLDLLRLDGVAGKTSKAIEASLSSKGLTLSPVGGAA
ncbi:hypothetical protein L1889_03705 [Paenalcaligenes niemegkensis]|uniref:hypothetical protein n=1 Tax=Paenalcaligenes niemegkensis TaxID=2895469 RepID=UPI001EE9AC51|nr:hypothetical protein [Paenalcaligenes niemegkensis]MCQ9615915.1 hypothetical protein [Paenalcaligenes niemegkensis]